MRRLRNAGFSVVLIGLLALLAILIGESASGNAADVIIGIVFGAATAIPVGLLVALIMRDRIDRPRVTHNDNRRVIIYIQQPDGSVKQLGEDETRRLLAGPARTMIQVDR